MASFRKKPVMVEAVQFRGPSNAIAVARWVGEHAHVGCRETLGDQVVINTLEGVMRASPGDWIIKGVEGEFYPCKPDIFAATYEPA